MQSGRVRTACELLVSWIRYSIHVKLLGRAGRTTNIDKQGSISWMEGACVGLRDPGHTQAEHAAEVACTPVSLFEMSLKLKFKCVRAAKYRESRVSIPVSDLRRPSAAITESGHHRAAIIGL